MRTLTYRQLSYKADVLAAGLLRVGVRPGDRVVLQLPNMPEYVEHAVRGLRDRGPALFALPAHRRAEVGYFCEFTDAAAVRDRGTGTPGSTTGRCRGRCRRIRASAAGDRPSARQETIPASVPLSELRTATPDPGDRAEPAPDDVAFLQLSGGTTGRSKLIPAHTPTTCTRARVRRDLRPRPRHPDAREPACRTQIPDELARHPRGAPRGRARGDGPGPDAVDVVRTDRARADHDRVARPALALT